MPRWKARLARAHVPAELSRWASGDRWDAGSKFKSDAGISEGKTGIFENTHVLFLSHTGNGNIQ